MASALTCHECGFDFAELSAKLPLTLNKDTGACRVISDEHGQWSAKDLRCPACGAHTSLVVARLGLIVRGAGASAKFGRWKLGGPSARVTIGKLEVTPDALEDLELRSACFERVPVFRADDGRLAVPTSPVRPDFFDCVDEKKTREHLSRGESLSEVVGSQGVFTVYLNGIDAPQKISLRLVGPRAGDIDAENAFAELNLRVWPRVPLEEWRHFLVGIAGAGDEGNKIVADPKLRVQSRSSGSAWAPLAAQRGGTSRVGAWKARPTWIALDWVDGTTANLGGAFLVPDEASAEALGSARFGLDFGTSNTCIAVDGDMGEVNDAPRVVRPVDETEFNQYVLRGGRELVGGAGPDLWPSPRGFGVTQDVFASELLLPKRVRESGSDLPRIDEWNYGVDYGLSSPGEPSFAEGEFLVRHFKWRELLRRSGAAWVDAIARLQARYWVAVLMQAYVRAGRRSKQWAKDVTVFYSYPMAFDDVDRKTLDTARSLAATWLTEATGVHWTITEGPDESTAAATSAGQPDANILVYLDLGGGSADVAVKVLGDSYTEKFVYLTSVAYAGNAVLESLAGREPSMSCLSRNESLDTLHRRVRESGSPRDLLADETLFKKAWAKTTSLRIRHFYGYFAEYIARLIAAGLLDRRFAPGASEDLPRYGPGTKLHICFYFLGNGWGFAGHTTEADPIKAFTKTVMDRVFELVKTDPSEWAKEVFGELKTLKLRSEIGELPRETVPHPKAAVAIGLLKEHRQSAAESERVRIRRGALCVTTKAGASITVPWFAYYDTTSPGPPGYGVANNSSVEERSFGDESTSSNPPWYESQLPAEERALSWDPLEPKWPADLRSPAQLDPGLNQTRLEMQKGCNVTANGQWFPRGPYEILLEKLFKTKLGELA